MTKNIGLEARFLQALREDGAFCDLTTSALRAPSHRVSATFLCKAPGVFSGGPFISRIFRLVDPSATVSIRKKDGQVIRRGDVLARVRARESAVLSAERLSLNLVCHLSGVATLTRRYVEAVKGSGAAILDTRKTTPLWRDLERWAVLCGGGENHRFNLADAVLVKDNHWALLKKRGLQVADVYGPGTRARRGASFVAIEAADRRQVWEAIKARADIILLDNMPMNRLKEAVVLVTSARKALGTDAPLIEVSGGVTLEKAAAMARLGVDRISVGALTHSAPALDISLEVD